MPEKKHEKHNLKNTKNLPRIRRNEKLKNRASSWTNLAQITPCAKISRPWDFWWLQKMCTNRHRRFKLYKYKYRLMFVGTYRQPLMHTPFQMNAWQSIADLPIIPLELSASCTQLFLLPFQHPFAAFSKLSLTKVAHPAWKIKTPIIKCRSCMWVVCGDF